ncbi:MAG: cell division protein ZapA [Treponema sp.]|jgi:cell division protein ZapA (FtsZ GTPase activity inhibitor)|nr:cell division protein ZapA [Treponema sp.]
MAKTNLCIDVLGTSFSIAAEEDSDYLNRLLENFKLKIETTQKETGLKDPLRVAILTGYLICDELQRIYDKQAFDNELVAHTEKEIEEITAHLITYIDEILE